MNERLVPNIVQSFSNNKSDSSSSNILEVCAMTQMSDDRSLYVVYLERERMYVRRHEGVLNYLTGILFVKIVSRAY